MILYEVGTLSMDVNLEEREKPKGQVPTLGNDPVDGKSNH